MTVKDLFKKLGSPEADKLYKHPLPFDKGSLLRYAKENGYRLSVALDAVEFLEGMSSHLQKAMESGEFGLVKKGSYRLLFSLMMESPSDQELRQLFKDALSKKHLEALDAAMAAKLLRDTGQDSAAQRLINSEARRLGEDARKINVLFATGLMTTVFRFQLRYEHAMSAGGDPNLRFRAWFVEQLKFYSRAVFVNADTESSEVQSEVELRTIRAAKPLPRVQVWASGIISMDAAHRALVRFIQSNKDWEFTYEASAYGSAIGVVFTVFQVGHEVLTPKHFPHQWKKEPKRLVQS